jgi:hypothetical protein
MKRLLICVALAACAPASRADVAAVPAPATTAADSWERVILPFEVRDAAGRPYTQAFIGGFDVPRPQFVDIDADSDLDLFVQERSNAVMFFENTGTAAAPTYVWRTDRYRDLTIGEWYRFIDMDSDGDYDLLAEELYSHIRMYRNEGTSRQPDLKLFADTLRDANNEPIFADRQNIANAADIDCNKLMDLFLGRVDGTVTRYEETARSGSSQPRFRFVTDRFENIEIVAQNVGSRRHGANTMYFADNDADGDLDLFWGDFFEPGVLYIRNNGNCQTPNLRFEPEPLRMSNGELIASSGYNVPVLVDIDADRDLDLFMGIIGGAYNPNKTASDNFHFYERSNDGYTLRTKRFLDGIDVGSESVPSFGDIDGDGDLDMAVGTKLDSQLLSRARLYVFRNDGTSAAPRFQLADTVALADAYHYAPVLADLNGDGRLDLMLGTWNNGILFYANRGTSKEPDWVQDTTLTIQLTRGSNTTPALVDIDGDGDLDLFAGEASGAINFYRNTGSARAQKFDLVSDEYLGIDPGRRSHPSFVDIDGDGDQDMILGREEGGAVLYRNNGTKRDPKFTLDNSYKLDLPSLASPVFVDLDGDARPELITGNHSGGLMFFRR